MKIVAFSVFSLLLIIFLYYIALNFIRSASYYWGLSVTEFRQTLNTFTHAHLKPHARQILRRKRFLHTAYSIVSVIILVIVISFIYIEITNKLF